MIDILGYKIKSRDALMVIVIISAILRFWGLGSAEIFHDEGFYAFRSIGYLDYIQNDSQTTPIQWFANTALPWWTNLSFHDHPPLFFLVQHLFFALFGDSLFFARLPSALAGIASIVLIFLIGRRVFKDERAGLLMALLLGINHIHSWISRSALMESVQILAALACLYLFLLFLEDAKKWFWVGALLGISFLIKYTSIFLVPVFAVILLMKYRQLFLRKELWYACALAAVIFSPVLMYNFNLYRSVGHFDLQFAYLFHQATPEWQASLGKIQDPFSDIGGNLLAMYSIPFLLLAASGFVLGIRGLFMKEKWAIMAVSSVLMITLILVAIGSAYRFIALYSPFFVILAAAFLLWLEAYVNDRNIFMIVLAVVIVYELYFTFDGIFLTFPDFGVVKLDHYFDQVFNGSRPAFPPNSSNPHLEKIIEENLSNYPASTTPSLLVYDENISLSERLWVFTRRVYYHGIPAVTTGQFKALLRTQGTGALKNYKIYFVKASQYTSLNPNFSTPDAADLELFLQGTLGTSPAVRITGYQGLPMFDVYEFSM